MEPREPRTLIVSSDADLIEKLRRSLDAAGVCRQPTIWSEFPSLSELRRRLREEKESFSAAICDMSQEHEALRLVSALRDSYPDTVTVVVNGQRRLGAVVRAKQAGAWGYLTEPYDLKALAERLGVVDWRVTAPQFEKTGRLVAFLPAQGGAGASTVALNAAAAASRLLPGSTLLIDYDFHCGTAAFQLQLQPAQTVVDALRDGQTSEIRWDEVAAAWGDLAVLVGPSDPSAIGPAELAKAVSMLESAKRRYGCTVLDLPPSLLTASAQALRAADRIYVVCTPEITSLHLAKRLTDRIRNLEGAADRLRLLVNRVGSWGSLDTGQIRKVVGLEVDWALDNDYAAVRKAAWSGGPIDEPCALKQQVEQLAKQFLRDFQLGSKPAEDTVGSPAAV